MDNNQLLDSVQEFFTRGVNKSRQGDHKGAISDFNQSLQLNPNDADAYGNRCVSHYKVGDKQRAIEDCQKAAELYLEQGKTKNYQYAMKVLEKLQQ